MAEGSTRERLLSAALDLFSVKGYDASSVDEIAESIGIKGPNIYKYFKGKQGLYDELVRTCKEGYYKSMGIEARSRIKITSAAELKELSMKQIHFTLTNDTVKKLRKMLNIEQYRSEEMSHLTTYFQYGNLLDLYSNIFRKLIDRGVMLPGDPELLGLEYIAPTALLIQVCDREPEKLAEVLDKSEKLIDLFIEKNFVPKEEQ